MAIRNISTPILVSMGLHALAAWSLYSFEGIDRDSRGPAPIMVSYVGAPPSLPKSPPPAKLPPPPVKKEALQAPAKVRGLPTVFSQQPAVKNLTQGKNQSDAAEKPKTAAEFLSDPQKGRVYLHYFSYIKEKIHQTVLKKYSPSVHGMGEVALVFVLRSDGRLEGVTVSERDSKADTFLKKMASDFLRETAPFGPFPPELDTPKLAFNVTIYFEENP